MANKKQENKNKKKESTLKLLLKSDKPEMLPKCIDTVQKGIPIKSIYEKYNLIETYEGCYTKSYSISNINYQTATEEEQEEYLTRWRAYLNSLGTDQELAVTVFNRNVNMRQFQEEVLLKDTGDGYDYLRQQLNDVLLNRIMEGKNGISRDTYLTMSVHTNELKKAVEVFKRLDADVAKHMSALGSEAKPIKLEDKLEILHDIYNMDNRGEFLIKTKVLNAEGKYDEITSFDIDNIRAMGLSVNDIIAPSSMIVNQNDMEIGNQFVRVLKITDFSTYLSDEFLTSITNMPFNMLTTINARILSSSDTERLINNQLSLVKGEKNEARKMLRKNQQDETAINQDILDKEQEIMEVREEINKNDEHLFKVSVTMAIFASDMVTLNEYSDTVISECKKCSVTCSILSGMQEEGFVATLPLCVNPLEALRTMKSSSLAVMVPFSNLEVFEKDGINYSMHAVSKNLIIYNRESKPNYNGFVLGSSGCVDKFTEYFNGKEWKSIADYTYGEKVLQFDLEENKTSLVVPSDYINKPCDAMYRFTDDSHLDMVLSEEHRVVYYDINLNTHEISAGELATLIRENGHFSGFIRGGDDYGNFVSMYGLRVSNTVPEDYMKYCFTVPTHTLVLRRNGKVFITGNSGKSFTVKTEITNVFLRKNADIMIIDPECEYVYITHKFNGQVIPIRPGGKYHINPLDISANYEMDESSIGFSDDAVDPILEKASFVMKLFESMMNQTFGMDSVQKSLIDRCLRALYAPFMKDGRLYRAPAPEETPTLTDMMKWFGSCEEPEARALYFTLTRFAGDGTLNLFSYHTNVELHNRIVCFDISAVGDELKLMAMNIIQDAMWSRLVENRKTGKYTYIYIDECHLFFQNGNESSADFLCALWKRARKYGGVPTGITQSVSDMIDHPVAKKLLSECNFVQILNQQSDEARERLKATLNLSDSSLSYIINAPIGQGILCGGGKVCVPFYSRFPKNNDIFPLLTSDMNDIVKLREKEQRQKAKEDKANKISQYQ